MDGPCYLDAIDRYGYEKNAKGHGEKLFSALESSLSKCLVDLFLDLLAQAITALLFTLTCCLDGELLRSVSRVTENDDNVIIPLLQVARQRDLRLAILDRKSARQLPVQVLSSLSIGREVTQLDLTFVFACFRGEIGGVQCDIVGVTCGPNGVGVRRSDVRVVNDAFFEPLFGGSCVTTEDDVIPVGRFELTLEHQFGIGRGTVGWSKCGCCKCRGEEKGGGEEEC